MDIVQTRSPEELSSYLSQWNRYERALEIKPEQLRYHTTKDGLWLDVRFYAKPTFDEKEQEFDHRVTARIVESKNLVVYEDELIEVDGRQIKPFAKYYWTEESTRFEIRDGNYVVMNEEGRTIGLITTDSWIIPLKMDSWKSILEKGQAYGYRCTCPDYTGQYEVLTRHAQRFHTLGALGACKHIMAVRLLRQERVAVPGDIPMVPKPQPPKGQIQARKMKGY